MVERFYENLTKRKGTWGERPPASPEPIVWAWQTPLTAFDTAGWAGCFQPPRITVANQAIFEQAGKKMARTGADDNNLRATEYFLEPSFCCIQLLSHSKKKSMYVHTTDCEEDGRVFG